MKGKGAWFFRILIIFFIVYLGLFIARQTGYYERTISERTILTEEKIKQFENDVAENKTVDINEYFEPPVDYSNVFTKTANKINLRIEKAFSNEIGSAWEFLKTLFIG